MITEYRYRTGNLPGRYAIVPDQLLAEFPDYALWCREVRKGYCLTIALYIVGSRGPEVEVVLRSGADRQLQPLQSTQVEHIRSALRGHEALAS